MFIFQPRSLFLFAALASFGLVAAPIETVSVQRQSHAKWVSLDANIEAVKSATVSAQTSGRIIKLNYDVNDIVPAGAPLLEITSKEQGAQLAAAEAEYARAKAQNIEAQLKLSRYQELYPKGAISKGAMDEAIARAKSAEQAVSAGNAGIIQARESLNYTVVTAPFSGIVTGRHVQVGETVSPGQPLLSGYATEQMRAVTQVPQRYIKALRQAPEFILTLSDGREYTSRDLTIFNFADPASHSYQVRINFPREEADLVPGTLAKASFKSGQRQQLNIPATSLITMNELSAVYLKRGDEFVLNQVRLGAKRQDEIEVLAGLSPGDEIAKNAYQVLLQTKKK